MKNGRKPQQHPNASKAIGYIRVSTEEQGRSGLGLEASRQKVETYCQQHDLELVHIYQDILTGTTMIGREQLKMALSHMEAREAEILISPKGDRLARSARDFCNIQGAADDQGWYLILLDVGMDTRTIMGRAMAQMSAVFAEMEARRFSERTREALAQIPRGTTHTDKNGKVKNPPGRAIMVTPTVARQIISLHRQGRSQRDIAKILNEQGEPSPLGKGWERGVIRRVLDRAAQGRVSQRQMRPAPPPDNLAEIELDELAAMTNDELDAVAGGLDRASVPA